MHFRWAVNAESALKALQGAVVGGNTIAITWSYSETSVVRSRRPSPAYVPVPPPHVMYPPPPFYFGAAPPGSFQPPWGWGMDPMHFPTDMVLTDMALGYPASVMQLPQVQGQPPELPPVEAEGGRSNSAEQASIRTEGSTESGGSGQSVRLRKLVVGESLGGRGRRRSV